MNDYLNGISLDKFKLSKHYNLFHGDLQFDNIIYQENKNKFFYIDWRDSFADSTSGGDLYYDFAKLYGGLIFNYFDVKTKEPFTFEKGDSIVNFNIEISDIKKINELSTNEIKPGQVIKIIIKAF